MCKGMTPAATAPAGHRSYLGCRDHRLKHRRQQAEDVDLGGQNALGP